MDELLAKVTAALTPGGDIRLDEQGRAVVDATVHSRALARIRGRRGEYYRSRIFGSDLHTLVHVGEAQAEAESMVRQALAPELASGEILDVEVVELEVDQGAGSVSIGLILEVPGGDRVQLDALVLSGRTL